MAQLTLFYCILMLWFSKPTLNMFVCKLFQRRTDVKLLKQNNYTFFFFFTKFMFRHNCIFYKQKCLFQLSIMKSASALIIYSVVSHCDIRISPVPSDSDVRYSSVPSGCDIRISYFPTDCEIRMFCSHWLASELVLFPVIES